MLSFHSSALLSLYFYSYLLSTYIPSLTPFFSPTNQQLDLNGAPLIDCNTSNTRDLKSFSHLKSHMKVRQRTKEERYRGDEKAMEGEITQIF